MTYILTTTSNFDKQLKKLDKDTQRFIVKWIKKNLQNCENPRATGKALSANLKKYWRYRIGNYRLLTEINDNELVIIAVAVDQRSVIYDKRNTNKL